MRRPLAALVAALAVTHAAQGQGTRPVRGKAPPRTPPRPAAPAPAPAPPVARQPVVAPPALAGPIDTMLLRSLTWREIGPYRGGRSVTVSGSVARPNEYWFGGTGAGVFKTTDGGESWTSMTDKYFGGTIGAVAVAPSNPDVVYVGGGEYAIRGNVTHGEGVWKTTDGGKTWTSIGLTDSRQISRIRIHPTNPDLVWVAVQGHVWGPNPERGIFRSADGGKTWTRTLFVNDSTGASDLALDPNNPNVLYAAFWQAHRKPWQLVSGGPGSGIFKSTDGGVTWTSLRTKKGMPSGLWGNIGLSVSGANSKRVFAIIEADSGGVFRSDDAGETWTRVNDERKLRQRAWYYSKIHADPKDTNVVYVNNVSFQKSTDGGKTWRAIRAPHGDSHDLWIAPDNSNRFIEANDGGANVTTNGGRTWSEQDVATAQFYHVSTTNHFPYKVCGAQQDNSTLCGPSRKPGVITIGDWQDAGGGESGYVTALPNDPDIVFAGSYGGFLTRKDMRTETERNVNPWPLNPMGHSAGDLRYRMQWTFPIVVSPHDPKVLYVGSNVIFRTTDEGESYDAISPDLTRNDPRTLGPSGGPITRDQTGVEYYGTVFTLAESPLEKGVLWAGTDDGLVQLSRDGGASWINVTPKLLRTREWARVSIIEASSHKAGTAYVAANRFQQDDLEPYLFRTTDYGLTWTRIDGGSEDGTGARRAPSAGGIAADEFTRVIREDPARPGLLYAGTERGVWASTDDGATWFSLRRNLPPVPVHDLAVKEGDLVAGTHGRSFWILDDLSVLRQLSPAVAQAKWHLYQPKDAHRVEWGGGFFAAMAAGNVTPAKPVGANPQSGMLIEYRLSANAREVTLEILDSTGTLVRRFTSQQDSAARADSITRSARVTAITDSLVKSGLTADSARKRAGQLGAGMLAARAGSDEDFFSRRSPALRLPDRAGTHRVAWNMRWPDAQAFEGMIMWAAGTTGPMALPGTYTIRLSVDGEPAQERSAKLLPDPRATAKPQDYVSQFELLRRIAQRTNDANDGVRTVRSLRAQVTERMKALGAVDTSAFAAAARPWLARLADVEDSLYQTKNRSGQDPLNYPIRLNNQIAALAGVVASADARPTKQSVVVFDLLSRKLDGELTRLKTELGSPLEQLNQWLAARGQPKLDPGKAAPAQGPRADDDDEEAEGPRRRR
ncbi:MAG: glycosyl hydrolase [Gemmatimonadaceae bacterium]|nr:glycosyl hydrolase [Gemmatimonadaceae bacterium]